MAPSTLYPKIGKLSDVIYRLRKFDKNLVTLSGTIKLHGTHADMVVKGDEIQFQSRNRMDLTLENDNIDFVKFAQPLKSEILALRDLYITRYQSLNPGTTLLPEMPLIIAGEWCGSGIQKKVAITKLPKHFVIVSVQVNGAWILDMDYKDIANESVGI